MRIITGANEAALAVPERTTFRRDGQWHVFTVKDGKAVLSPVAVGLRNEKWVEITSGLSAEDVIIMGPMNDLEPGVRVQSTPPAVWK